MKETFEGQCQCGNIKYQVVGVAATVFACHCTECQRQSGSAFGMALWVKEPEVKIISGQLQEWVREMPSSRLMSCSFCSVCGTRVFHKVAEQNDVLSIKPGTLNNCKNLVVEAHIWTGSKHEWLKIEDGAPQFNKNPDSFSDLMKAR
ncbi:GFA family protein [Pseudomonas putida]|uniref:GFA family protein n=1 Tax=Pseudomonas putida TaxID=303 RepID=UPI003D99AAB0